MPKDFLQNLLNVDFQPTVPMSANVRFEPNLVRMYETVPNTQCVSLVKKT